MRYSNRGPVEFFRSNELSPTPFFLSTPFHHSRPPAAFFRPFSFFFPFFTLPTACSIEVERRNEGRKKGRNVISPSASIVLHLDESDIAIKMGSRSRFPKNPRVPPSLPCLIGLSPPRIEPREAGTVGPQLLQPRLLFVHARFIFRVRRIINLGWA